MLIGLLASTGLRVSEALNLRLDDLLPDGVLHIHQTKFNKSRLVPMHASVVKALQAYLKVRRWFLPGWTTMCSCRSMPSRWGIEPSIATSA